jgi:hypothetical protein
VYERDLPGPGTNTQADVADAPGAPVSPFPQAPSSFPQAISPSGTWPTAGGPASPADPTGPAGPNAEEPPTAEHTTVGGLPLRPANEGPVFNQTTASVAQPVEGDRESRLDPFSRLVGKLGGGAPRDGGPPLTRFRDLPFDTKMRIWRLRALIVVIVGIVFTVIANWEVGITLAIIAGIADTIYRSRSVEAGHIAQPGTVDRATLRAQKRTIRQLNSMSRAGYVSLHVRPIPDSVEVIDHLVVGPTGVYAIDSEKWDKKLPIRQRNSKQLWLGPKSQKERLDHAKWEAEQASERLSAALGTEVAVQPALAIYGPKISWVVINVRGVDVFAGPELKKYLRRRARRRDVPHLSNEQIAKIRQAATDVLPLEWREAVTPVG